MCENLSLWGGIGALLKTVIGIKGISLWVCMIVGTAQLHAGVIVTQTANTTDLANAVASGPGFAITSVNILNGADVQFGTYSNFSTAPITMPNGIILSSGLASEVGLPPDPQLAGPLPSNDISGMPGTQSGNSTPEFDAYGATHIQGFTAAYDVAALQVNFNLAAASQVQFDVAFGSVEFPFWVSQFPDSVLGFLDGLSPTNQIMFDTNGNAIQVGTSFSGLVTTADNNTAFANPHGMLKMTTTTTLLSAGNHTLTFEVGDVNDHILDSAAFIAGFRVGTGATGTVLDDLSEYHSSSVPEPASLALCAIGGLALVGFKFVRWNVASRQNK